MANGVLRHRTSPAIQASEEWISLHSKNLPEVVAHDVQNVFVRELQDLLIAAAAQKTAHQSAIFRSAVGKLVMNKRGSEQALAFAARHQKPKARRQTGTHILVEAQRHRYRGAIRNGLEFGGQWGADYFKQRGRGGGRGGHN